MAGEWIPVDVNLGTKPEVQELVALSGEPVEVVVYRLLQLWGWAALNTADGQLRGTAQTLASVCGGTPEFWFFVRDVSWICLDECARTITISNWERRFSSAAKARQRDTARKQTQRRQRVTVSEKCPSALGQKSDQRRGQYPPPPPQQTAAQQTSPEPEPEPEPGQGWALLRDAWNKGPGTRYRSPHAPGVAADALGEPAWLLRALEAIPVLASCRYFTTPVDIHQFCGPGFVDRVLAGKYLHPPKPRQHHGGGAPPPPRGWDQANEAALARTLKLEAAKLEARKVSDG
jgi:hypothetical protein